MPTAAACAGAAAAGAGAGAGVGAGTTATGVGAGLTTGAASGAAGAGASLSAGRAKYERTAGAANPGRPYPVGDALQITIPNGRVRSAVRHANWEGSGVTPDVPCAADDALPTAHALAVRRLIDSAAGVWRRTLESVLAHLSR